MAGCGQCCGSIDWSFCESDEFQMLARPRWKVNRMRRRHRWIGDETVNIDDVHAGGQTVNIGSVGCMAAHSACIARS